MPAYIPKLNPPDGFSWNPRGYITAVYQIQVVNVETGKIAALYESDKGISQFRQLMVNVAADWPNHQLRVLNASITGEMIPR